MANENVGEQISIADEVQVNYFVLCDQVITEAQTSKQSLIGIYSALMAQQLPILVNVAVALCIRVRSPQPRELVFRFIGPDGEQIFNSPNLPCDWNGVRTGLQSSPSATLQIGLNLQSLPLPKHGLYEAEMYCDGHLLATYPLSVLAPPPPAPPQTNRGTTWSR